MVKLFDWVDTLKQCGGCREKLELGRLHGMLFQRPRQEYESEEGNKKSKGEKYMYTLERNCLWVLDYRSNSVKCYIKYTGPELKSQFYRNKVCRSLDMQNLTTKRVVWVLNLFFIFIYLYVCACTFATTHMRRSEDRSWCVLPQHMSQGQN